MKYAIGIGSPRSGSTWLYEQLRQHPDVVASIPKETKFFADVNLYRDDVEAYEKFFPGAKPDQLRFEFDPSYIYMEVSPENIKRTIPNAKLIALVREPIDRAISHYQVHRDKGKIGSVSFAEAIEGNPDLYLLPGLYARHLQKFISIFGRDKLLILLYDDLKNNPDAVLSSCLSFLELSEFIFTDAGVPVNTRHESAAKFLLINRFLYALLRSGRLMPKWLRKFGVWLGFRNLFNKLRLINQNLKPGRTLSGVEVSPETRKKLVRYYEDDVKELSTLLGRDLRSLWFPNTF